MGLIKGEQGVRTWREKPSLGDSRGSDSDGEDPLEGFSSQSALWDQRGGLVAVLQDLRKKLRDLEEEDQGLIIFHH